MKKRVKYKKIPVIRQSYLPVTIENTIAYKQEWSKRYEELERKHLGNIQILQDKANELETELKEKYNVVEYWDWGMSQVEWKKILREYGPVATAVSDAGKLMYVIMDQI